MALVEAYFDESGTHKGSSTFCMGGYIFDSEKAKALTIEWQAMLEFNGNNVIALPHFHMADCTKVDKSGMGVGIYKHLTAKQCDFCAREAIRLIKKYATWGVMISLDLASFDVMPHKERFPTPYSFVAFQTMMAIRFWANQANYNGEVAFIYEAGADHNAEAHKLITEVKNVPELRGLYRYGGHSFQEKAKALPLQTADILAWHSFTHVRRKVEGSGLRKDLKALLDVPTKYNHYDQEAVLKMLRHMVAMEQYVLDKGATTMEEKLAARDEYVKRFGM